METPRRNPHRAQRIERRIEGSRKIGRWRSAKFQSSHFSGRSKPREGVIGFAGQDIRLRAGAVWINRLIYRIGIAWAFRVRSCGIFLFRRRLSGHYKRLLLGSGSFKQRLQNGHVPSAALFTISRSNGWPYRQVDGSVSVNCNCKPWIAGLRAPSLRVKGRFTPPPAAAQATHGPW